MDQIICHHGIKGMKWGVRRFRKKNGDLTPAGKDRYSKNTRTDSFVIRKGSTLHRSTMNESEENRGHAFASFKTKDARGYARRTKMFSFGQTAYDMTMVASKDLISPSRKERVDTFVQLMLSDPAFYNAYQAQKRAYSLVKNKSPKEQETLIRDVKKLEKEYSMFSAALGGSSDLRDIYFKALDSKGYNMIIDDADASVISDSPVLIFDRASSLEVLKVSPITRDYLKTLR